MVRKKFDLLENVKQSVKNDNFLRKAKELVFLTEGLGGFTKSLGFLTDMINKTPSRVKRMLQKLVNLLLEASICHFLADSSKISHQN